MSIYGNKGVEKSDGKGIDTWNYPVETAVEPARLLLLHRKKTWHFSHSARVTNPVTKALQRESADE